MAVAAIPTCVAVAGGAVVRQPLFSALAHPERRLRTRGPHRSNLPDAAAGFGAAALSGDRRHETPRDLEFRLWTRRHGGNSDVLALCAGRFVHGGTWRDHARRPREAVRPELADADRQRMCRDGRSLRSHFRFICARGRHPLLQAFHRLFQNGKRLAGNRPSGIWNIFRNHVGAAAAGTRRGRGIPYRPCSAALSRRIQHRLARLLAARAGRRPAFAALECERLWILRQFRWRRIVVLRRFFRGGLLDFVDDAQELEPAKFGEGARSFRVRRTGAG